MDLGLAGKVVVVGGSTDGIGKASALAFAREGARVVICGRNPERVAKVSSELGLQAGVPVMGMPVDLTVGASIEEFARSVLQSHGTVHVLVNNCGGPRPGESQSFSDEEWHAAFDQVVMSALRLTRRFLPAMRAQRWGRIINIQSYSVRQPLPDMVLSNSLRLAAVGWAKTLSREVASDGVLVNTVCPGWTLTDRLRSVLQTHADAERLSSDAIQQRTCAAIPAGRFASPAEIANVVTFLGSECASYVAGAVVNVDGGATHVPL